jgi:hypothetical protein
MDAIDKKGLPSRTPIFYFAAFAGLALTAAAVAALELPRMQSVNPLET